ncbi:MAG TPA: hypothetical protein VF733_05045 [Candidatus Saccharimonadales bacterium]
MAVRGEDGLRLPSTPLLPRHLENETDTLLAAAREALYSAYGDAQPTLEPLLLQGRLHSDNNQFRLGYAAVTRLVDPPNESNIQTIPLHAMADPSFNLSEHDQQTIREGLDTFRPPKNLSWATCLGLGKYIHVLSRLVANPRRFTADELGTTLESILYEPLNNDESHTRIDRTNVSRAIRQSPLGLIEIGKLTQATQGRPPVLWSMPQEVINSPYTDGTPRDWLLP